MAKIDVLDILRAKKQSPMEFNFDNLWIPPMYAYLTPQDIEELRRIATSIRLSSKIELKYRMIDDIMRQRGFKRFSGGTNRVVYSHLEDTRFVAKIAVDRVGMQDNPMEFRNQFLLKPYCTKMFCISPCGTVGFAERVLPIKNKKEFKEIAEDVFEILVNKILGKYVVDDVGTKYFMNYGIRAGFAPVLLDYPYVYKLDGKRLYCSKVNPENDQMCNGEIDYDSGFNHLVCTRCGKVYLATDLRDDSTDNKIIIKGGSQMKIVMKRGNEIIGTSIVEEETIIKPKKKNKSMKLVVKASGGNLGTEPKAAEIEKPKYYKPMKGLTVVATGGPRLDAKEEEIEDKPETEVETSEDENFDVVCQPDLVDAKEEEIEDTAESVVIEAKIAYTGEENKNKRTYQDIDLGETSSIVEEETEELEDLNDKTSSPDEVEKDDTENHDADLSKFGIYDEDDEPSFIPMKKKKVERERDANGRFISTGAKKSGSKTKSNFIPSK